MNATAITFPLKGVTVSHKYISAAEVAKRFDVTARTVVRWINDGDLPGAFKVNPGAKNSPFLIPITSVDALDRKREREQKLQHNGANT